MTSTHDITLHWFLPTYGDSRSIEDGGHGSGFSFGQRETNLHYLTQLALSAESNGFESVLVPTGLWCGEGWTTAAALIARTTRLKFLVAYRPGLISTPLLAQQTQSLQDLSDGRLNLNVVVGGEDHEQRAYGDFTTKEERYERANESLELAQKLWTQSEPVTTEGKYEKVENAQLAKRPNVVPQIYFGGSSAPGIEVAAQQAEVYLTWGEQPEDVKAKIDHVAERAAAYGRTLEYGLRVHVIARPTEEEAWAEAQRLLDEIDPELVERIQAGLAKSQSEGQRRQSELHKKGKAFTRGTDARDLEIAPNLWTGVGLIRGGAGTALVGSYDQVAERLNEYKDAGINHFVLSGYPHLEEAWHVGEGLVPALQNRGLSVKNHKDPDVDAAEKEDAGRTPFVFDTASNAGADSTPDSEPEPASAGV
ncbi:LLM class flavin-dependent oxidoreductase [Corynebacterium sp. 320]|uniref:LLM class flavin-dependent oxidoreductase n=1 Tax=Corynebacterium TaxID=1716 RepID=UPI00125CA5A6|nr:MULTISPECIES: LLM class flavin-dependent oxidoreductase [Corynebacterium]KAB1502800.1 LLM class flavin-dependent oxidoreductase [Corynebacterium sp. 320]KAB3526463.1 LLM class flavin-dependent oxidoreductase [Corynebacterium sp. 250]QNP92279.1 LLM class flavin-dependent oxidoreductase [Corynebacterium zhongnanshanii]